MKTDLEYFKTKDFHAALRDFFKHLNIPVSYIAEEPVRPQDILSAITYKADKEAFQLMADVYFLGMVDDAAFEGGVSLDHRKIQSDYDGILVFGVTLHPRDNGLAPTRSQLAEITRAFNREFHYTPVVVVFRYGETLAFANAERLPYKQEWREGEKAGKVSLLRDVAIDTPHSGHLRILSELAISRSGKQAVNSFAALYSYWQTVFNVSLLNKKFYEELSNWYFWAIKEVTFPGEPTIHTLFAKSSSTDDDKLQELKQEHNAKNVIRLLTRFLFVWFIKEKKLIPPELFDLDYVKNELVKDLSPYHQEGGLFQSLNRKSHYYKGILQNLFFATLNQEMGKRDFRKDKQHMNVTNLLRYESCFKNPRKFIDLVEAKVPFMNGGLFECLDKPHQTEKGPKGGDLIIYQDGFSDRDDNPLVVPDYLFFGMDEEVDLSSVIGITNKKTSQAAVKGLIKIFNSYKFTIAENTPIEEDIALDPELLGKVFENLLASYNPETKTTARKQTGSFYTPREIVNYMVDESLIAYLKNDLRDWGIEEEELSGKLHKLLSFDPGNPFAENQQLQTAIIKALDNCTILDPACGSGAFPMGILQKMVHVLQKLDPENEHWHELQMEKAIKETESVFHLVDKEAREQKLLEINEAFDRQINDPDYARKLFLIENCIYGVDIQPIAAQISKLRFFISLVVDQKVDKGKENFGIRPLPNLETKFVAANTLIGIEKPEKQGNLFANKEIKELEEELKKVRHRIFSAKTPKTKRKLREEDQTLREKMGELLIADGWPNKTARQLAAWDPYDQNASSPFFDPEWMFGITDGFDVVIGNPPYLLIPKDEFKHKFSEYFCQEGKPDLYRMFIERANIFLSSKSVFSFITPNTFLSIPNAKKLRKHILETYEVRLFLSFDETVFESASVNSLVFLFVKGGINRDAFVRIINDKKELYHDKYSQIKTKEWEKNENYKFNIFSGDKETITLSKIQENSLALSDYGFNVTLGAQQYHNTLHNKEEIKSRFLHNEKKMSESYLMELGGKNIHLFQVVKPQKPLYVDFSAEFYTKPNVSFFSKPRVVFREIPGRTIISSYTEEIFLVNKSCYSIIGEPEKLKNLQLVISSSLIGYWVSNSGDKSKQKLFPRITKQTINKLPIKLISNDLIAKSIHGILSLLAKKADFEIFRTIQNAIVFETYFPDHMKEKQIDILQFVENDLAEVMQGRDFEKLPDSEKENIINQLHTRWTHPDSEVRNRIKLFAVRSPDILKPILESR